MRTGKIASDSSAPFYLNTIDQLNDKISGLSVWLSNFNHDEDESGLVIDCNDTSRFEKITERHVIDGENEEQYGFGQFSDDVIKKSSHMLPGVNSQQEMDKFAGVYSFKVVHTSTADPVRKTTSRRSFKKRIQEKFGMSESKTSSNKRPMLVELHSFPGFDRQEITALPFPIKAENILETVTEAQIDLKKKPTFRNAFARFFHSDLSQAILQDTFWWFFCHKYQPTRRSQESLFNRIAHNYTKQMVRWIGSKYQDTIFKRYPNLVSQAVYCSFCHAFPTSYRQFDDNFKDDLISLVFQWIAGTKPAPRTFDTWNFAILEPSGMRKGENLGIEPSSKMKKPGFDLQLNEDSLGFSLGLSLGPSKQKSTQKLGPQSHSQALTRKLSRAVPLKSNLQLPSINVGSSKDSVAAAAGHCEGGATASSEIQTGPERESRYVDDTAPYVSNSIHQMSKLKKRKESCIAGRGPRFSKNVFDTHGRSPLVEQFLLANHLATNAGTATLVRRTEISELPSATDPTYQDIIKESLTLARKLGTKHRSTLEENATERSRFLKKQKELQKDFIRRTAQLMSNPKAVKKISDLLKLEILRDPSDANQTQTWRAQVSAELNRAMGYDVSE